MTEYDEVIGGERVDYRLAASTGDYWYAKLADGTFIPSILRSGQRVLWHRGLGAARNAARLFLSTNSH